MQCFISPHLTSPLAYINGLPLSSSVKQSVSLTRSATHPLLDQLNFTAELL
jgi:hypothetical protein